MDRTGRLALVSLALLGGVRLGATDVLVELEGTVPNGLGLIRTGDPVSARVVYDNTVAGRKRTPIASTYYDAVLSFELSLGPGFHTLAAVPGQLMVDDRAGASGKLAPQPDDPPR
jgi:hypothetical protein